MIARDKEMHVIGHYRVTPNHHVMIQPSFRVINESTMDASVSQNFPPARCAKRDKKKEADHKFGIFDPAATVDYGSFHGGVAAGCRCSCRRLSRQNPSISAAGDGGSYNPTDTPPDKQYSAPSSGRNSKSEPPAKRSRPLRSWPALLPQSPPVWSILCDRK